MKLLGLELKDFLDFNNCIKDIEKTRERCPSWLTDTQNIVLGNMMSDLCTQPKKVRQAFYKRFYMTGFCKENYDTIKELQEKAALKGLKINIEYLNKEFTHPRLNENF